MNYKFKTKPFEHQLKALEMYWDKKVFAYFMEMGTGKSKVLIDNIAMLYDKGKINGALIIAPKGVYKNWYSQEIPNHMPDHVEKTVVMWEGIGSKKKELEYKKSVVPLTTLLFLNLDIKPLAWLEAPPRALPKLASGFLL